MPRLIKYFDTQQRSVIAAVCGSTFTLAISDLGGLFMMGQNKRSGEANMYPKPVPDLTGWDIHLMTCGQTSILVSADDTVIAWGPPPTYGELGFGEFQKSSASPKEVKSDQSARVCFITKLLSFAGGKTKGSENSQHGYGHVTFHCNHVHRDARTAAEVRLLS